MARNWNEPLPMMDQAMCNRITNETNRYLEVINWRNDGEAETLEEAVALALHGKDAGLEKTLMLRPTNRNFEDWMNWSAIMTLLFKRDSNYDRLLEEIRKPIKAHNQFFAHFSHIVYIFNR